MDKREAVAKASQELLMNCESAPDIRTKPTAFTRQRQLGPQRLLLILLRKLAAGLQLALDEFFDYIKEAPVSKQALSKARQGLNPEYVRKFADAVAEAHALDKDAPSYHGMRLIAIDGTDIALENSKELREVFGCSGSKNRAATALGSLAYGPLDHAVYDSQIAPYATDERNLAKLHMARLWNWGWAAACCCLTAGIPRGSLLPIPCIPVFPLSCGCGRSGILPWMPLTGKDF